LQRIAIDSLSETFLVGQEKQNDLAGTLQIDVQFSPNHFIGLDCEVEHSGAGHLDYARVRAL